MSDPLLIGATSAHVTKLPVVQEPGRDHKLSSVVIGGPDNPRDRVLVLSVPELVRLLEVARTSPVQRVELPYVGVKVDTFRGEGTRGIHEVWKLRSGKPRPGRAPAFMNGEG